MKRKAIIIANPGDEGEEDFLPGVDCDVDNYQRFLLSPLGGAWKSSELTIMRQPTVNELRREIRSLTAVDYAMAIFSGHGWYSSHDHSTFIELRRDEEVSEEELWQGARKQTVILDCCRVVHYEKPVAKGLELAKKAEQLLDPEQCREYYDQSIAECPGPLVVMYSCGIGETSADVEGRGGLYSFHLVDQAYKWGDTRPATCRSGEAWE